MLRTCNFHTLYELCEFVRENDIDVYSDDVKYLGESTQSFSNPSVCYAAMPGFMRAPKYTIRYEDHQNNVGPLEPHYVRYVEDFSED
jgi:hypothetical protein